MLRRLFTLGSALALLLCLATVVMWVRSSYLVDCVNWTGRDHRRSVCLTSGRRYVIVNWMWTTHPDDQHWPAGLEWSGSGTSLLDMAYPGPGYGVLALPSYGDDFGLPEIGIEKQWAGFGWQKYGTRANGVASIRVPFAWPAGVLALWPLGQAAWLFWPTRRKRGACLQCHYDLRVTPDRCPECGTPVPKEEASA